jgi:hypothetical protein
MLKTENQLVEELKYHYLFGVDQVDQIGKREALDIVKNESQSLRRNLFLDNLFGPDFELVQILVHCVP